MLVRQALFWRMIFRWRHNNLSGPGANELLHLLIADLNLFLENGLHPWEGLRSTLLRILRSTWWFRAVLKELWSTFHRLSRVRHGCQLWLIVSIAGSFLLLIQFTSSHGPWLLFAISWTFSSFQDRLHSSDHHCLEYLEIFNFFAFFPQAWSMIVPSWLTTRSSWPISSMLVVSKDLKFEMMSLMKLDSWSLFGAKVSFDVWMISLTIRILTDRGAWSEESLDSGRIEWWSSSDDPY